MCATSAAAPGVPTRSKISRQASSGFIAPLRLVGESDCELPCEAGRTCRP
jgi:hypothetical protein